MPVLRFTVGGKSDDLDTDNFLLSEAEVLEEHAGMDVEALADAGALKKVRTMGHFLWLLKLRQIAAEQQVPLAKAAVMCPRDDFDVPLGSLVVEEVKAVDPPVPTRTPRTRTPPGGSSRPRKRTAKSATPKSAASPTSSASAPGKSAS